MNRSRYCHLSTLLGLHHPGLLRSQPYGYAARRKCSARGLLLFVANAMPSDLGKQPIADLGPVAIQRFGLLHDKPGEVVERPVV
jgi:hypothetical protein